MSAQRETVDQYRENKKRERIERTQTNIQEDTYIYVCDMENSPSNGFVPLMLTMNKYVGKSNANGIFLSTSPTPLPLKWLRR